MRPELCVVLMAAMLGCEKAARSSEVRSYTGQGWSVELPAGLKPVDAQALKADCEKDASLAKACAQFGVGTPGSTDGSFTHRDADGLTLSFSTLPLKPPRRCEQQEASFEKLAGAGKATKLQLGSRVWWKTGSIRSDGSAWASYTHCFDDAIWSASLDARAHKAVYTQLDGELQRVLASAELKPRAPR